MDSLPSILPPELLLAITATLAPREASRLSRTCKTAYYLVGPQLWKHLELAIPAPEMDRETATNLAVICEQHCIHHIVRSPRPVLSWVRKLTLRFVMHNETSAQFHEPERLNKHEDLGPLWTAGDFTHYISGEEQLGFYQAAYGFHTSIPGLEQLVVPIWLNTEPSRILTNNRAYNMYGIDFWSRIMWWGPLIGRAVPKGGGSLRSLMFDVYGNEVAIGFFMNDTTNRVYQAHTAKKVVEAFRKKWKAEATPGRDVLGKVAFRVSSFFEQRAVFKTWNGCNSRLLFAEE